MNINTEVGFYGKLPMVGDFVSRRLPSEFISSWDGWLQSAVAASREALGDDWLNSYLTSPIWRFLLSPGLCGNQAVAGIIMPSVDRVGRYYPLTVAVLFEPTTQLPSLFTSGNVWFEQLEDAALMGLDGKLDLNGFDRLIQTIPPFSLPANASFGQQVCFEKKAFYIAMESMEQIGDAFVGLNANLLATFMSGYSLWRNAGSEQVQPALLACQGLPPIGSFASFLKGKTNVKDCPMNFETDRKPPANKAESGAINQATEVEHPSLSSILAIPSSGSYWRSWAVTDTGKRRQHNEDALLNRPEAGLWVIADGMGGHKAGDVASQLIVNSLNGLSLIEPLEDYLKEIENCLQTVNSQLRRIADEEYANHLVGSTVVALVCEAERCGFLWAGDSRLYRFRHDQLQQLTQDHCETDKEPSSSWSIKDSNIITRAVGADEQLDLDMEITEVLEGDVFLLCSDGLDKEMSFQELEHVMQTVEVKDIAGVLIEETLARGAKDNVSVIVVTARTIV